MDHLQHFLEHLRLNRNVSPHTVAAYQSDLTQFIGYAHRAFDGKPVEPSALDVPLLRG